MVQWTRLSAIFPHSAYLKANSVQIHLLELDVWILLSSLSSTLQEQTVRQTPRKKPKAWLSYGLGWILWSLIGHLHDVGLVDHGYLVTFVKLSVFESKLGNTSRSWLSNQFDTLNNSVDNLEGSIKYFNSSDQHHKLRDRRSNLQCAQYPSTLPRCFL